MIEQDSRSTEVHEPTTLEAAFAEHATALLRLGMLLTGRRDEAEDLVQETFVRVHSKLVGIPEEAVASYLRTTAINIWRNRVRRMIRERRWRSTERTCEAAPRSEVEDRDELWRALLNLPPRQRACVVLRYYADLPEHEIARTLECSVGTVKSQTAKALARLRKRFADED